MNYDVTCPTCGELLSIVDRLDEWTGKISFEITCEWCDEFRGLVIETPINITDLKKFSKKKEPFEIKVRVVPSE